jgi:lysophospholipase L1-like esterase
VDRTDDRAAGEVTSARLRALFAKVGLLVASLALVLALAETAARLAWHEPVQSISGKQAIPDADLAHLESVQDLAQPNVRGIHRGVLHETNDQGLRGPTLPLAPPAGIVRIGIGGDSFTMGWRVEWADTYVVRVEQILNREAQTQRFQTLNFGLAGLDAGTAIDRLVRLADLYSAGVIVYGFTVNDIEGPHYVAMQATKTQLHRSRSAHALRKSRSYLVRTIGPSLQSLVHRLEDDPTSPVRELDYNYFENPAAAADFEAALDAFAAAVRARDGCGLVLIHTHLSELGLLHPLAHIYDHVERLAHERGLPVVQSLPAFSGLDEPSLWVGPMDPHPNAEGHRILAGVLARGLRSLPPHCLSADGG